MTSKDMQSLQKLHYEITMLFSVLFQSIKYLEFEKRENSEQVFCVKLLKKSSMKFLICFKPCF